ncbi:hypothetical protein RAH42_00790 [Pyramidobacter sp. YE332]|uniref:hypothetical protein n=1 Tax=Pyramidobacter sp. YE332 TaxID=3068894 RepID=UPI00294B834C|nr:hypothetical protein [Pyramidobacter sp. YE332]WOL40189.1 hypothetical protein RAH42_00790 [Pyramidobacter sp. YE332]
MVKKLFPCELFGIAISVESEFLRSFFVMEFSKVLAGRRLSIAFSSKYFLKELPFSRRFLSSAGKYAFVLVEKWIKCG